MDFIKCEEKLIARELEILNSIKDAEKLSSEKVNATIKTSESLSSQNGLVLPLKVKGKMLGVGRHKERFYTADELKKSVYRYQGKRFPIKLDHKNGEVSSMVGGIDNIYWIESENAIGYEGHINDETMARNILDNLITDVSATIFSMKEYDAQLGIVGKDLEYDELSLVKDGAFKGNTIEVVQ